MVYYLAPRSLSRSGRGGAQSLRDEMYTTSMNGLLCLRLEPIWGDDAYSTSDYVPSHCCLSVPLVGGLLSPLQCSVDRTPRPNDRRIPRSHSLAFGAPLHIILRPDPPLEQRLVDW